MNYFQVSIITIKRGWNVSETIKAGTWLNRQQTADWDNMW